MIPLYFKSEQEYNEYLRCIDKIEIGDEVVCVIGRDGDVYSANNTDMIDGKEAIFPIIGKNNRPVRLQCGRYIRPTMIGVDGLANQKLYFLYRMNMQLYQDYKVPEDLYPDYMSLSNVNKDCFIYTNRNLDIIYKRIIKKKKQ